MAEKGHNVTLLDLSKRNIEVAKEKSIERGISLKDYLQGNTLELGECESEKEDVILLMGPLYHLIDENLMGTSEHFLYIGRK